VVVAEIHRLSNEIVATLARSSARFLSARGLGLLRLHCGCRCAAAAGWANRRSRGLQGQVLFHLGACCFSLVETFGVLLSLFFLKRTSAVGHDVAPRFVSGQLWLASIAKCSCWTTGLMDCDSGRLATVIFLQEIQTQKIYIRSGLLLTTAKGLHRPDPVHQACCRLCI